jgi:hypothetical protein
MASRSNPYDVLGVSNTAPTDELRRAYRSALRRTHPDTGGDAKEFHAVQAAWDLVGTPEDRDRFDRASAAQPRGFTPWARSGADAPPRRQPPQAAQTSYGHPGGWWRSQYVGSVREWAVARGLATVDPYDPQTIAELPGDVRQRLHAALTEEATAAALNALGSGFTVWHDVSTDVAGGNPDEKLDHIVLGPTGLFALLSEDREGTVHVRGADVSGDGFGWRERPIRTLTSRARFFSENVGVRFTAVVMVVPDDSGIDEPTEISRLRGLSAIIVNRSDVAGLLRLGIPGVLPVGRDAVAAAADHLRRSIQFV